MTAFPSVPAAKMGGPTGPPAPSVRLKFFAYLPWLLCYAALLALCGAAAKLLSPLVAAPLYLVGFGLIAYLKPDLALAAVFALAPFAMDLSGGGGVKFSIAEINLAVGFIVYLLTVAAGRNSFRYGPLAIPVAMYLAVCVASAVLNGRASAISSILQMVLYLVAAVTLFANFVRHPERLYVPLYGLVVVGCVLAVVLIATGDVLGLHKNSIGASLSSATIVAVGLLLSSSSKKERRILTAAVLLLAGGLVLTLSRGSWLAAIVGVGAQLTFRGRIKFVLRATPLLLIGVIIAWAVLPEEAKEYATGFERSRRNIAARWQTIEYTKEQFVRSPLLGVGTGLRKELDATNIVMVTLAETGVLGLASWALVHVVFLRMCWRAKRRLLDNDPLVPPLALGFGLVLGRLAHGLVDHYWSRGAITPAWAAAGLATAVFFITNRRRSPGLLADGSSSRPEQNR